MNAMLVLGRRRLGALFTLPPHVVPSRDQDVAVVRRDSDRLSERHTIGVSTAAFKVLRAESRGSLCIMENSMTKKGGPPRHLHRDQDEWFYAVAGEFVVEIGSQRIHLGPGDSILGPRQIPHAYAFVGNGPGKLLLAYTPANRIEEFFRGRTEGAAYSTDAARYRAYDLELLGPPLQIE
jgi:mannose-6-phosphate isomerase-like protein (cupin superfamily)